MATDALNSAKATSNLTESKIAHKITQESQKLLHKNNSETNEEKNAWRKIYISRTKTKIYWWSKIKGRNFLMT